MKPDAFLGAFVAIRRSNVGLPHLALRSPASPLKRISLPFLHLGVDDAFDDLAGLFHHRREDRGRVRLATVIPENSSVSHLPSIDAQRQVRGSPVLSSLLP